MNSTPNPAPATRPYSTPARCGLDLAGTSSAGRALGAAGPQPAGPSELAGVSGLA